MPFSRTLLAAALVLAAAPGLAQGRQPQRAPAKPPAAAPAPEPAPTPIISCRTAEEVCFLGIVVGAQVVVIYTNAPNGEGVDAKPLDVLGPDGAKIDMTQNNGRVVMLAGAFDPKAGITKAEIVEVGSPLASLAVKAQLAASAGQDAPPQGRPASPPRRR